MPIILTAVLSAGNSGMYASTRMLWDLAREGKAPKFLAKLNKRGVPVNALIATALVGSVAFSASFFGEGVVILWLLNASGMSGFHCMAWDCYLVITVSESLYCTRERSQRLTISIQMLPIRSNIRICSMYGRYFRTKLPCLYGGRC